MDLIVTDVKLKYGLMLWEDRHYIVNQVKKYGSAKLLVDTGFGCECGSHAKFPYELISRKTLKLLLSCPQNSFLNFFTIHLK